MHFCTATANASPKTNQLWYNTKFMESKELLREATVSSPEASNDQSNFTVTQYFHLFHCEAIKIAILESNFKINNQPKDGQALKTQRYQVPN